MLARDAIPAIQASTKYRRYVRRTRGWRERGSGQRERPPAGLTLRSIVMRLASSLFRRSCSAPCGPLQPVWRCSGRRAYSASQIPIHEQIEAVAASAGPELAQSGASTAGRRIRPRRSALYMPGSRRRALEKARTLEADCIIMDRAHAIKHSHPYCWLWLAPVTLFAAGGLTVRLDFSSRGCCRTRRKGSRS